MSRETVHAEDSAVRPRAMVAALAVAGTLFIVQTWVASLLVPDPQALLTGGDPEGTAFYDAAAVAGGRWLSVLTAVTTAVAWGFANAPAAQVATSRLPFAMARDGQLPRFLARVSPSHPVPERALLLVAAISLPVGVYMTARDDAITLLGSSGPTWRPRRWAWPGSASAWSCSSCST